MRIDTDVKLLKFRRTKIVATIGPVSNNPEMIRRLIDSGVDAFRMNMSHGTYDNHRDAYDHIRRISEEKDKPVAVIADLCGPKIRVGKFKNGAIELTDGETVTVTTRDVEGIPGVIPSQYKALADDVQPGSAILLDDGNISLSVDSISGSEITCRVIAGGRLSDHKGMNLPGVHVSAPTLTEKDRQDAAFALLLGVDFIALSFVRKEADIHELRTLINNSGSGADIIAKIEKPEALYNIEGIIDASDAVMVARGDLGVELAPESVPAVQEQLIGLARKYNKPIIIATQMLESMITNPKPTRAEVSDVANAVRFGADAIMLSGETAVGKYPVKAVEMMDHVARQTEGRLWELGAFRSLSHHGNASPPIPVEDAVAESTAQLSRDLLVRSIVAISMQDSSVAVMSSSKPAAPIVGLSHDPKTSRIANLYWGVIPVTVEAGEFKDPYALSKRIVKELGLAEEKESILIVHGFSADVEHNRPSVTVLMV